ncbi:carboxyl transferase domain-containing protein [Scenedesmus sp. NREL 46B-D3]|nr:carboxyl transferase domain-containing protein [Scenedesmus sp. NREL 46B-D3]
MPADIPNGNAVAAEPYENGDAPAAEVRPARGSLHSRTPSFLDMASGTTNPNRMGLPKRPPSLNIMVDTFVAEMGGDRPIYSVLVANNGLAAVKFMRSIRTWAVQTFGHPRAVAMVAMATPEDIRINAEHVMQADQFVEVPGGTNNNNYANVKLIVQVAERAGVDAVWPGWGHASEIPELPQSLAAKGIRFLGPPADAMAALGDKIGSTILAQAAGVPTLPWSGSGVAVSFEECNGVIPEETYNKACVFSLDEAIERCQHIGYPIMLKASWGGGGKGIRKVHNDDEVRQVFKQIQGEVPGSPIFAMKLAPQSRHLEVQLVADRHGNVTSLFTRDCSVQRRHQKIIEEGPALAASQEQLRDMERCARALARSVGYQGAATVEYLYLMDEKKYCFLELNPRLQVEHPVTEGITETNIPSIQLMVGMGIPLWRMPELRASFDQDPKGDQYFDLENTPQRLPQHHVVAVRITSENAGDGFKPTAGRVDEVIFKPSPNVWGYFSVKGGGGIHEFSDSQFGHLFAKAPTREAAIRAMVVALRDVRVRGEIHTIIDYAADMLQSPEFMNNEIHTGWLDSRIAANVRAERPPWHLCVIGAAAVRAHEAFACKAAEYLGFLAKGQLPPHDVSLIYFEDNMVIDDFKYKVKVIRRAPFIFNVQLNNSNVDVVARKLGDGGFLLQVDGESHVLHTEEEAMGTRLVIDNLSCLIAKETDPSRLVAQSPGKLVRQLVANGEHVEQGQRFAVVEVMKMMMDLLCPAAGVINFNVNEGAALAAGELIAHMQLDDPTQVRRAQNFTDNLPQLGPPQVHSGRLEYRFKQALSAAKAIMAGYNYPVEDVLLELVECLDNPALSLLQWNEEFSYIEGRLPSGLAPRLNAVTAEHEAALNSAFTGDRANTEFPGRMLIRIMRETVEGAGAEKAALQQQLDPLVRVAKAHAQGPAEYARSIVQELLSQFADVEEKFQSSSGVTTEQEMVDALRKSYPKDHQAVLDMVISHQSLKHKVELVNRILSTFVMPAPVPYRSLLRRFAALSSKSAAEVALRAQQLLEVSLQADLRAVVARALSGLDMFSESDGKLSPTVSAGVVTPFSPQPSGDVTAGMRGMSGQATVVPRKTTLREGVFTGLTTLMNQAAPTQVTRHSSTGGAITPAVEHKIETLVGAPAAVEEALASLIVDNQDKYHALQYRALVTYIKRLYFPFLMCEPQVDQHDAVLTATWMFQDPRHAQTEHRCQRMGAFLVLPSLRDLAAGLKIAGAAVSGLASQAQVDPSGSTLHIAVCNGSDALAGATVAGRLLRNDANLLGADAKEISSVVAAAIKDATPLLSSMKVGTVSVLAAAALMPVRNGFVWDAAAGAFKLEPCLQQVEPPVARLLELDKVASLEAKYVPSRNRRWHMYNCKEGAGKNPLRRTFLRGLVRHLNSPAVLAATYSGNAERVVSAAVDELEEALTNCLEELTRPAPDHSGVTGRSDWVHLFHSVLPALPLHGVDEGRVASALRSACAALVAKHNTMFRTAGVAVWEMRFRVPGGAWRLLVSCPTGHEAGEEHVEVYRESLTPEGQLVYKLPMEAGLMPPPTGLHGTSLLAPYQRLENLQVKRLSARRFNTTYCYDFPSVFENALRSTWAARAAAGEPQSVPPQGRLVEAHELVLASEADKDFTSNTLRLKRVERGPGNNDVGMVAWHMTLKTPECQQGRQVIAVANDITHKSGSFGPTEDALFRAAGELALEQRLPLVYLAANSGARVGLAEEVQKVIQVAWEEDDPSRGIAYMYLTEEDYAVVGKGVKAQLTTTPEGEKRWVLQDIIGNDDGLGVENLSGSAAIGTLYCKAWREGFTITLVSGRTVGIGAYLARLGRRCVQRTDQPIILTGYSALNKVLGRQVYTSQMQLGGPRVMGENGVSHYVVNDDLEGVKVVLRWLSYCPPQLGAEPPLLPTSDPVDRPVAYEAGEHEKLDPRAAISGRECPDGWESGLFDKNSFTEAQAGWARTVVTGRARLGGIPVGVIAVETQTVERVVPADPGSPDTSEQSIPQAGQVWFPDSADKTAQAIEEFDREGLPLFILANWRGFAGGQRDLFDGVLQAGSTIVENLRVYKQPVFVYIPGGAELRGGAWVVVDSQINPTHMQAFADPRARGGVLEPEGVVEIKYKQDALVATMHRIDPVIKARVAELKAQHGASADDAIRSDAAIKARVQQLLPAYRQMALRFADMHDTPQRMLAKGVLQGVVPWREARRFFAMRLKRRLTEEGLIRHVASTDVSISRRQALAMVRNWSSMAGSGLHDELAWGSRDISSEEPSASAPAVAAAAAAAAAAGGDVSGLFEAMHESDRALLAWAESPGGKAQIAVELKALRSQAASRLVQDMLATGEGKEGLIKGLQAVLATDSSLATQLRALVGGR